jgi:hypothetical protein
MPSVFLGDRSRDQRNHPSAGAAVLDDPEELAILFLLEQESLHPDMPPLTYSSLLLIYSVI